MESDGSIQDGVILALIGLGIVFLILSLTATIVFLMRHIDEEWKRREAERERVRDQRPATIDTTTAVLIAAAVTTYLGGRARIRSVRRLLPANAPTSPWSAQGRAVLMGSHMIERRDR